MPKIILYIAFLAAQFMFCVQITVAQSVTHVNFNPIILTQSVDQNVQDDKEIDIYQDGLADFKTSYTEVTGFWRVSLKCLHGDVEILHDRVKTGNFHYISGIMPGNFINVDSVFESSLLVIGDFDNANIANLGEQYIGFRIRTDGLWHYGWLRVHLVRDDLSTLKVKSYTINDRPGAPILSSEGDPDPIIKIRSLEIIQEYNVFEVGKANTLQLKGSIFPQDADLSTLKWSIENMDGEATISQSGLLVPIKAGQVKVKIESIDGSRVTATKIITILETPVLASSIDLTTENNSDSVFIDSTLVLTGAILPTNTTNFGVDYSVSNDQVATIGTFGVLRGLSEGEVTVYAETRDGTNLKDSIQISVLAPIIKVANIQLSTFDDVGLVQVNRTLQMVVNVLPENANLKTVTWSVQDRTGAASIDPSGLLTGIRPGLIKVIASAKDGSGIQSEVFVQVTEETIAPTNVSVFQDNYQIAGDINRVIQFKAKVSPQNVSDSTVSWSIRSLTGSATIGTDGSMQTNQAGEISITATSNADNSLSDTYDFTIFDPLIEVSQIDITTTDDLTTFYQPKVIQLSASISPGSASLSEVYWVVENMQGEAEIEQDGKLRAVKEGTVKVKAFARDGSGIVGEKVIDIQESPQIPISRIKIRNPQQSNVAFIGTSIDFEVEIYPTSATNKNFVWRLVEETGKANLRQDGTFYPLRTGWVTVQAISLDGSGLLDAYSVYVQNKEVPVYSIRINSIDGLDSVAIEDGTMQMRSYLLPTNISNNEVQWSVINASGRGTIDEDGIFKPIEPGVVQIKGVSISDPTFFDVFAMKVYQRNEPEETTVGIFDTDIKSVKLFPNPANDIVHIDASSEIESVEIMNMIGQRYGQLFNFENNSIRGLSILPSGMYILMVRLKSNEIRRARLIKR